jgi:hypothetical protein
LAEIDTAVRRLRTEMSFMGQKWAYNVETMRRVSNFEIGNPPISRPLQSVVRGRSSGSLSAHRFLLHFAARQTYLPALSMYSQRFQQQDA